MLPEKKRTYSREECRTHFLLLSFLLIYFLIFSVLYAE